MSARRRLSPRAPFDPNAHHDDVQLTTSGVMGWIGATSSKGVYALGMRPIRRLGREHCYLARDVKRAMRGLPPLPVGEETAVVDRPANVLPLRSRA
jgi:hypothetical protein